MATKLMSFLVFERRSRYLMSVEFMLVTVDISDELNMTGAENIVETTKPNATYNDRKTCINILRATMQYFNFFRLSVNYQNLGTISFSIYDASV